jgi:hypothetical protein
MNAKKTLEKIQGQSESTRKIIVWGVTITLGIVLVAWWFWDIKSSVQDNQNSSFREQLQLDSLEEEFNNIPIQTNGGQ